MRHPVLCTFLALILTFTTAQPFAGLNAAELWNSQKEKGTSKKTYYYNQSKSSNKKGITLYNSQSSQKSNSISLGGGDLKSTLQAYKNVKVSGQHPSKLWKFMSTSALKNRQADIDHALQIEYKTRQDTAKKMTALFKEVQIARIKAEKEYQKQLADYYEKKEAEELEKQKKKEEALSGAGYKSKSYSSKNSGKKKVYKISGAKDKKVRLKKPKRLFNSPSNR